MKAQALTLACLAACTPIWQHRIAAATEITAVSSLACDGTSTMQYLGANDPLLHESNPLLGDHPGTLRLWSYLGGISAAVIAANRLSPDWARILLNGLVTAVEVQSAVSNMSYGASFCGIGHGGPWPSDETARR